MSDSHPPMASASSVASEPRPTGASTSLQDRVQALRLPETTRARGTRSAGGSGSRLPWILCLVLLAITGVLGYYVVAQQRAALSTTGADNGSPGETLTETPTKKTEPAPPAAGEILLESKGYIIPAHQILVSPKVSGMIVRLHFDKLREGQRVPKGAALAEIESVEYQADLDRAKANYTLARQRWAELDSGNVPEEIEQAWYQWKEAEDQLGQFKATYDRNLELRRKNSISPQDFDLSKSEYEAGRQRAKRWEANWKLLKQGPRQERILAAAAEMDQAKADLGKAEWRFANCIIRAPISGTILKKNAEEGNIVNPVAFNGSFSLCEMADLSDLEVDLSIQERDVSRVFPNQRCKVRVDAFPDRVYDGYVSRLMPIADRAKGAIPVRVKIRVPAAEEGQYLKPEMGANVTFLNETVSAAKPAEPPQQPSETEPPQGDGGLEKPPTEKASEPPPAATEAATTPASES